MPNIGNFSRNVSRTIRRITALTSPPPTVNQASGLYDFMSMAQARPMMHNRSEGRAYPLMPAQWNRNTNLIAPATSTGLSSYGGAATIGTLATATPTTTIGGGHTMTTGATAGNEAGTSAARDDYWRANGFFFAYRCIFPDASYGTGATGSRIWVGLATIGVPTNSFFGATGPASAADGAPASKIGFRYDTNASDVNWMLQTKNGTTVTNVSTGVAFAVNTMYDFFIYCPPSATEDIAYWAVHSNNGVTTGSTATTLPATTTMLRMGAILRTLTTTARVMHFVKMYGEAEA